MSKDRTKILKAIVFFAFLAAAAGWIVLTPTGGKLLSVEGRRELVATIDRWVGAAGPLGPALFVLIFTLGAQILPATPFAAAGAFIFGKFWGAAFNLAGELAAASLSFLLGRYFIRDFAKGFLVGKLGELDRKAGDHGFSIVFYLRILWFPFIVLNYAAGATAIRFKDYFWGTAAGTTPAVVITAYFFGSLKDIVASVRRPADLLQFDVLFPAGLLLFSFFLPKIVARLRRGGPLPGAGNGA